jgi:hypothetical protein
MRKMLLVALGVVLVLGDIVSVSAQTTDPRIGTWKLNVAKSQFSPGPPLQSLTVKVEASGQGEKVSTEAVNADGTRTATQYTANFDGKDYPLTGSLVADTVSLKRIDRRTTDRTDKKAGAVAQTLKRVVSQDGKMMTVTVKGKNAQGQDVNNTLVPSRTPAPVPRLWKLGWSVVDTDERVYRDSLLTDLTDLAEFVQNHRPTAP